MCELFTISHPWKFLRLLASAYQGEAWLVAKSVLGVISLKLLILCDDTYSGFSLSHTAWNHALRSWPAAVVPSWALCAIKIKKRPVSRPLFSLFKVHWMLELL